jgi:PAS domain S-box-containing protein
LITSWSGAATDWIDYSNYEALGRNVELIVPTEYREQHRNGLQRAMAGGPRTADAAPFRLPVRRSDGQIEVFAVRFVFLDDPHGRPIGATVVMQRLDTHVEPWTPAATATEPEQPSESEQTSKLDEQP